MHLQLAFLLQEEFLIDYERHLCVGKLNLIKFRKGFYAYAGSALSSLEKRIQRHFQSEKKIYWHIDYFLSIADAAVIEVIYAETSIKKGCEISESLMKNFEFIKNFGSSDCKCKSHLFFSDDVFEVRKAVINAFESNNLKKLKKFINKN